MARLQPAIARKDDPQLRRPRVEADGLGVDAGPFEIRRGCRSGRGQVRRHFIGLSRERQGGRDVACGRQRGPALRRSTVGGTSHQLRQQVEQQLLLVHHARLTVLGRDLYRRVQAVIERLERERLIDRVDDSFAIRRIGALLLAKRLEDFPELARKAPRVVVYTGTSKLETRLDQIGAKGYAVGFQGLIRFIMAQLPQNEIIKDALRAEVKLVPEVVVRELVANALIHQDLSVSGTSVMIEIYSNRLEISNPGEPVVPVERFIDGYQSRNERLASLMRRMGICEEKSSGIDRVVQSAELYQLPAPDFRVPSSRTLVVLYGPRKFEDMDRDDRVRACYQHCALKWVMSERMTNQTLRERFRLAEGKSAVVSQVISASIDSGLVKSDEAVGGSRKFARYLPFWA